MRDILTVIAGLLILALAAALVVPPFIDWEARRGVIERALSEAAGAPVETEGRIELRLLPSPRLRVDELRIGPSRPDGPALVASFVKAEMALMPLLSGQVRFTETRIGRAELRVPTAPDGRWRLPPGMPSSEDLRRAWAFEDLRILQFLVTTTAPATGRTDQFFAEAVRIEAPSLVGPWRVEGTTGGMPFRLATGELGPDRTLQVKLAGGGDLHPRFDVDARVALAAAHEAALPGLSGTAKILFGPPAQAAAAGLPLPVALQAAFKSAGDVLALETVSLEAGEGGTTLRLAGAGSLRLDRPRLALKLEGRRLELDSFLLSAAGQEFRSRLAEWGVPPAPIPIDLDLSLASIGLAQEELSNLVLRVSVDKGRAQVERIDLMAPGQTRVAFEGTVGLATESGVNGRLAIASASTERLLRYLGRLGLASPLLKGIEGQPLEVAADLNVAPPIAAFRNLRMKVGEATITGSARYTEPEGSSRGRLEAQIGVQGLDLNQLPQLGSAFEAARSLDVGLILDARGVRHGGREGAGRISARILSDGPSLFVESLDIVDLAGAHARVSGRIASDGSGRIAGKVTARRAAPLIDLLGAVWVGGVAKLVPHFLREGELDLDVVAERAGSDAAASRLRTGVRGAAAGGAFEAEVVSAEGVTESMTVRLATQNTGAWVDKPDAPLLRRPSHLELRGVRLPSGLFTVVGTGDIGGIRVRTARPFALGAGDDVVDSGEVDLSAADVTPFLVLLGDGAGVEPPVPAELKVTLGRQRDASLLSVSGRIAGSAVRGNLAARSRADVSGAIAVERLSLPWLLASFALNAAPDPRATSPWSTMRFGQSGRLVSGGQVSFEAQELMLGQGLRATKASFAFAINPDGVALRNLSAAFAEGRLAGSLAVTRQGSLASVAGEGTVETVALPALAQTPFRGRMSGALRFGASGETMAALVSNLAGAGELRIDGLEAPKADPRALDRALPRILGSAEPLDPRRIGASVAEELDKGSFLAQTATSPVTMVGGVMRFSPFSADAGAALWQGTVGLDVKTLTLDIRGTLTSRSNPKDWSGAPPYVVLGWRGPLAAPNRELDVGPLTNGLAAIVLKRELEKIEAFEADAHERARLNARRDMEAARQARLREQQERAEAERQARFREQQEAERQARLREEAERARAAPELLRAPPPALATPPPLDIRPPALQGRPPG